MKANIIEKAGVLFREKGYDAVTVNDVCVACGITKTTFYYHLKSKQDILLQFYDIIVENLTSLLLKMLHMTTSWDQLQLLFNHLMTNIQQLGPDLNSHLLSVNLQRKEQALRIRKELEEIAVDIIRRGQDSGQFRNQNNASSLYQAAAYMFTGYEYMWCTLNGEFSWNTEFFASLESILDVDPELRTKVKDVPGDSL